MKQSMPQYKLAKIEINHVPLECEQLYQIIPVSKVFLVSNSAIKKIGIYSINLG